MVDLLQNYTATTMLANSEFVALLKQANTDSSRMAEGIGVSEAQLRFVINTSSGMGLMKCGNVVIFLTIPLRKGQTSITCIIQISMRRLQCRKSGKMRVFQEVLIDIFSCPL